MVAKQPKVLWKHSFGQERFRAIKYIVKGKERVGIEIYADKDLMGNEIWLDVEVDKDLRLFKCAMEHWFLNCLTIQEKKEDPEKK
jgi:hypothetical protein